MSCIRPCSPTVLHNLHSNEKHCIQENIIMGCPTVHKFLPFPLVFLIIYIFSFCIPSDINPFSGYRDISMYLGRDVPTDQHGDP